MAEFTLKNHELGYNNSDYKEKIKSKKKYRSRRKNSLIFFYCFFAFISFIASLFILSNYEKITSLNFEIRKVNAIIIESEKKEINLKAKIESIKSDKDIVLEASTKLGMVFPEEDQVVYFTLNDGQAKDKVENRYKVTNIFSAFIGKSE